MGLRLCKFMAYKNRLVLLAVCAICDYVGEMHINALQRIFLKMDSSGLACPMLSGSKKLQCPLDPKPEKYRTLSSLLPLHLLIITRHWEYFGACLAELMAMKRQVDLFIEDHHRSFPTMTPGEVYTFLSTENFHHRHERYSTKQTQEPNKPDQDGGGGHMVAYKTKCAFTSWTRHNVN